MEVKGALIEAPPVEALRIPTVVKDVLRVVEPMSSEKIEIPVPRQYLFELPLFVNLLVAQLLCQGDQTVPAVCPNPLLWIGQILFQILQKIDILFPGPGERLNGIYIDNQGEKAIRLWIPPLMLLPVVAGNRVEVGQEGTIHTWISL